MQEKIVLVNSLSPGDVLMMTGAIRSLHKEYPGRFLTDVRSPCNEIFANSPYITPLHPHSPQRERDIIEQLKKDLNHPPIEFDNIKYLIAHYPEIHRSGMTGTHFSDGHRIFLSKQLNIPIPSTGMQPDIFFSKSELNAINPIEKFYPHAVQGKSYWVINAGIKNDYTLKWYDHYQEVIDLLKDKIQFVQVGHAAHDHKPLNGVLDMRGKTSLRELFRVCKEADGIVSCVSMPMVVAAALEKPCVVVAGAREGVRWQLNPDHQFLYRNGVMSCATRDGCWKSKTTECINKADNGQPLCMELIRPEDIVRSIELYYLGGRLPAKNYGASYIISEEKAKEAAKEVLKDFRFPFKSEEEETTHMDQSTDKAAWDMEIKFSPIEKDRMINAHIFNILRILKKVNPEDQYFEAYQSHYAKRGESFMDTYHAMHWIGSQFAPQRVLEVGCRTGVSICQLLSSYLNHESLTEVILCDVFAELGTPDTPVNSLKYLNIPTDKLTVVKQSSLEYLPELIALGKQFDYILVDGCHDKDYAKQDLINAAQLIATGGFILFDDITPDGCSLQDVWDEFKANNDTDFFFMENHNGKGIGIARKT